MNRQEHYKQTLKHRTWGRMPTQADKFLMKFDTVDLIKSARILSLDEKEVIARRLPRGPTVALPRYIPLTADISWALGFFMAEGSATYAGIGIANCEVALIRKFKQTMEESLGIGKEEWRAYIKTSDTSLEKVRKKWKKALRINHVVVTYAALARQDNIELRLNNTFFSIIFDEFVERALPAILARRGTTLSFLDGYEVGDGSIIQRDGYLYGIVITVKDRKMKGLIIESFKRLYNHSPRVRRTKGCYEVGMTGVHVMTRLILDGHFSSSERQWKKLLECYIKKEYPRSHIRYWSALNKEGKTINEVAQLTKRSHWSVRDALNKDVRLGLLNMERKPIPDKNAPYFNFYRLSNKGRKLIKIIKRKKYHGKECFDTWGSGT